MKTHTIQGNLAQHKELVQWAKETNEKMFQFIPDINHGLDVNKLRNVISMPENINKWFEMNCFLGFIKEYYTERNGHDSIYGGPQ